MCDDIAAGGGHLYTVAGVQQSQPGQGPVPSHDARPLEEEQDQEDVAAEGAATAEVEAEAGGPQIHSGLEVAVADVPLQLAEEGLVVGADTVAAEDACASG